MERLTFEGNFCDIAMCGEVRGGAFCGDGYCSQRKVWERLKMYEDLEEQGRLVELTFPLAILLEHRGEVCYYLEKEGIQSAIFDAVILGNDGKMFVQTTRWDDDGNPFPDYYSMLVSDFGKTVFFEREEAEAALAEN